MKARIGWQNLRQEEHLNEGKYYLVTGTDFCLDRIDWKRVKFVSHERYMQDQNIILEDGDILITKDGSIGKVAFIDNLQDKKVTLNNGVFRIRVENQSSKFIFYTFLSDRFKYFLQKLSGGSSIKHLYQKDFEKYEIAYPEIKEQKKIADCLATIDELITVQTQKLDALKTHKKGLMQQFFPAEGETVPKLRFPGFLGKWESHKLEELAKRGSGHTPNKQKSQYYNGGIKWVSLADSNKLDEGYIYETKVEISNEGIENSSAALHPAGTVILSRDAGVGKSAILYSEMAVSQHFIAWVCDESKLLNWFLYYVLQVLKPAFERIAVGNTIKTIGLPYFRELCISIPSLEEQQRVADCLTSIDLLITVQSQKLDALKTHKKGLMQQLFPPMDEVDA